MYTGKLIFSQVTDFLPMHSFRQCVERYQGHHKVKSFSCLDQYLCMVFAQLTYRESLRDISLLACTKQQVVPYGHSQQGGSQHLSQCKQEARLANLCRFRSTSDLRGPRTLPQRKFRYRTYRERLRSRFHNHRSQPLCFPLGQLPTEQSSHQIAYSSRFAWQHPNLHSYQRRQTSRCQRARRIDSRTWQLLHYGPRISGFCQTLSHKSMGRFFRYQGQIKFSISPQDRKSVV